MSDECDQNERAPSPRFIYLLHIMAGCNTTVSLETAKYLIDSGQCSVNDQEPQDLLTPLHVAASWDNLAMCQLLVHYGADLLAMNRDNQTPSDLAKGKSRIFLRELMKRGQRRKNRKVFKFLRQLFQPRRQKPQPQIQRSNSTQCIPVPPKPTLSQEIDDYLNNADTYNLRLSPNRMSGFSVKKEADNRETLIGNGTNPEVSKDPRTSSMSSYRTASGDPMEQGSSVLQTFKENCPPAFNDLPLTSTFPSLHPHEQLKEVSARIGPEPSAPPISPQITRRRKPQPLGTAFNLETAPGALPRSTSLAEAIVPKDIPPTLRISDISELNEEPESMEDPVLTDLISKTASLSLNNLKARLNLHKFSPGPLDNSNRKLYERKLAQLELNAMRGVEYEMKRKQMGFRFSVALERLIQADEINEELLIGMLEEELVRQEFSESPENDDISYFCYLLIDISNLLPNPAFRDFLKAIFYIGKGKRTRPLCHFADTVKYRLNPRGEPSKKIAHILDIWNQKRGVVSLHLFNNIHSAEALVREASMIEAMTIDNLDNVQRGNFRGQSRSWPKKKQAEYGAFLLKKAYNIFQNERCRPIFESDVIDMKLW